MLLSYPSRHHHHHPQTFIRILTTTTNIIAKPSLSLHLHGMEHQLAPCETAEIASYPHLTGKTTTVQKPPTSEKKKLKTAAHMHHAWNTLAEINTPAYHPNMKYSRNNTLDRENAEHILYTPPTATCFSPCGLIIPAELQATVIIGEIPSN